MRRLPLLALVLSLSFALPLSLALAEEGAPPAPVLAQEESADGLPPEPDLSGATGVTGDSVAGSAGEETPHTPPNITDEAQRIWDKYGDAIYQVQVIDLNSDTKNSIGSGFQFSKDGLIATNYHVVAEALQRKENNRLEYLHDKGEKGPLKILIADVAHDLAILKMDKPGKVYVDLGRSDLPKGSRLFSLGNPHDIGFTIIEGTYNGVSKESFIDKIHFSGSLNPGMSGGPALSHDGKVVGVNVLTAGNNISFLVPVEPLKALVAEQAALKEGYDFLANANTHIEEQLLKAQQKVADILLGKEPWKTVPFGTFTVPGRISLAFKCWGDTTKQEKQPYREYSRSSCSSQDRLFLDNSLDTGTLSYNFNSLSASDKINPTRFYNYYETQFQNHYGFGAREEDVTNFDCNTKFVDIAEHRWKAAFCARQYKKYPRIYDMQLYLALIDNPRFGLMASLNTQGMSKDTSLKLAEKFMKEIRLREATSTGAAAVPELSIVHDAAVLDPLPQPQPTVKPAQPEAQPAQEPQGEQP